MIFIIILPISYIAINEMLSNDDQSFLKLNTQNPEVWQYFTHSFVHSSSNHLQNNLISYFITIVLGLILSIYSKNLKIFLILILITVFIFPLLWGLLRISYLNMIFPSLTECGSSGVISAFLGFLPCLFVLAISNYYQKFLLFPEYFYSFLILTAYLLQETYKTMNISITLWVLYFTFLILFLIFIILFFNKLRLTLNNKKSYFVVLGSIILFILLYTFLVGTLFPQQLISEEGRTAIETHYIGVLFGLFTSYFLISLSENHRFKWLKC